MTGFSPIILYGYLFVFYLFDTIQILPVLKDLFIQKAKL